MKQVEALEILEMVGADTYGLVTTSMAAESGVPRSWVSRLARNGHLERLRQGVYALPSATLDKYTDVRGAWLSLTEASHALPGDKIVASGPTAAFLHGVGNLIPTVHEFTTTSGRLTRQHDIVLTQSSLRDGDVQELHGVAVTTPARTVRDLVRAGIDGDHLGDVVRDFLGQGVGRRVMSAGLENGAPLFDAANGRELLQRFAPRG
ncbi:type IV toxin-antitoxin system AbiEi family antitoxin domain-containing protein [Jonesiaceae bacterium BS-20]|uniref:Type IV toxin-antitoxin system AbiEi family antitoxin domain-containing protein n=1 Tax=Jonesiaceae bacterium BS-20 TaxID=3120821 RepID=A0AAU7E199_9MICO